MSKSRVLSALISVILLSAGTLASQSGEEVSAAEAWATTLYQRYSVIPDVTYLVANNWEAKLDIYRPTDATSPTPTVVYLHGGGWVGSDKDVRLLHFFPYLEMGWAVVNVEYRLAKVSLAPAAVEDCRCALRWVVSQAGEYNFDTSKIVVTGKSAGGHLSLTTGILPVSAGFDRHCFGETEVRVAAIVNWYGITDVNDLLEGDNIKSYAVAWLGSLSNRHQIAQQVSPLTYIRPGLPPVLTIHGDDDPIVPYDHAVRLHQALSKAGVPNQLVTIPKGKHGGFSREEVLSIQASIRSFLKKHGLRRRGRPS